MEEENEGSDDEKDNSFDVFASVKTHGFFSINSLKLFYLYTIGSCVPSKCSTQPKPLHPEKQTIELEEVVGEKRMKKRVNRHFENHVQKYLKRFHFPWKPIFHILLVALVTVQVIMFADDNSKFTKFLIKNKEAFEHYFKLTKCNQDIDKLYTLQDVYDQITVIVNSYYNVSRQAVGSFRYINEDGNKTTIPPTLTMKIEYYSIECGKDESNLFPYNGTLTWYTDLFPDNNNAINISNTLCCDTETTNSSCSLEYCDCSVEDQISCYINETNLDRINVIAFDFELSTFFRNHIIENKGPVHAKFHIQITLLNDLYSSMTMGMEVDSKLRRYCNNNYIKTSTIVDGVIILLVFLSSVTYTASVFRTYRLTKQLRKFFVKNKGWVSCRVACGLYNKWYIFMLFTNLLMIIAITMKIISDYKEEISIGLVDAVRILLGIGIFVLWCGLFGLLSYFENLNELFSTIQIAFPKVWRLAGCIIILFIAFTLSGWLVLGPYHPKFGDIPLSMESLYCMLNGDDLYTTFKEAHLSAESVPIKLFSELYLVLFIFVFIFIVLSMFIGIFDQAYASLSKNVTHGTLRQWAETELHRSVKDHNDDHFKKFNNDSSQNEIINTESTRLINDDLLTKSYTAEVEIEQPRSTTTKRT